MRPSDVMEFINDLETSYPVDQWQVDGVHLWPIARFRLAIEISNHLVMDTKLPAAGPDAGSLLKDLIKSNIRFVNSWWKDKAHNAPFPEQIDIVFLSGGITYADINGKYYEKFCDPMLDYLTQKGFSGLFLTAQNRGYIPRHTASRFIQPHLDKAKFSWLLKHFLSKIDREQCLPGYQELLKTVKDRLGFDSQCLHRIELKGKLIKEYSKYFKKILRKLKPRMGAVVCYYNMEGYALSLACNQLNIPCMDLQHGFQGPLHPAYGKFVRVPAGGYSIFPKLFWCWGENERNTIHEWASRVEDSTEALAGTNLFLEMWRSGEGPVVSGYDERIQKILSNNPSLKNILITLQTPEVNKKFWHLVDPIIRNSRDRFRWWIRSHPGWLSEGDKYRDLYKSEPHIEFKLATKLPLYALLRHMDLHVTYGSSTIFEAADFGVASVMLTATQSEYFSEAFEAGIVVSVETEAELEQAIQLQFEKKKSLSSIQEESLKKLNKAQELLYNKVRSLAPDS